MRTAEVKFALRAFLREYPYPSRALSRLNEFVCNIRRLDDREDNTFVVLALAVVDVRAGEVLFSLAGAEPPLVLRADGSEPHVAGETFGLPLGVLPQQEYGVEVAPFAVGDLLLMTTDGITEARPGPGGDLFGYERMRAVARQTFSSGDPEAVAQAVLQAAETHAGGSLHDDVCLLAAARTRSGGPKWGSL